MAIKFNKSAFLEQIAEEKVTEKKTRATREPKIDNNQDEVDLEIYRAILYATSQDIKKTLTETTRSVRNGVFIADLLLSLRKFSKVDATNRNIVKEAIESLQERRLVRSTGFGRDQFVFATDGGHYNEIKDFDANGTLISKRVVTSFFSRNENPLKRLYIQQQQKAISLQIQSESEFPIVEESEVNETEVEQNEVTDFDGMEPYVEPEFEFAPDDFSDDGSELNSDIPEI